MSNPIFSALGGQQMNPMAQLVADAKCSCTATYALTAYAGTTA